jgi:hypothetical protein
MDVNISHCVMLWFDGQGLGVCKKVEGFDYLLFHMLKSSHMAYYMMI